MTGSIVVGNLIPPLPSDLLSNGKISVGGNVTGQITVSGAMEGDIDLDGDMTGTIAIDESLKSTGRVLIDGLCDGPITIGEETVALSQIQMSEGLGANGSVTINDARGNFNANGDIYVGQPGAPSLPFPVVFDGSILVKDTTSGADGDLNGGIKVVGCHSTTDDLDICICGSVNGLVGINQTGCVNQVGWSCVSGCP